jgi:4'-phosphopantetheinyl transferase
MKKDWSEAGVERVFKAGLSKILVARLDAPADTVHALSRWLCDMEQRRAARFRFERDRRRYIVARARLRQLLAAHLDVRPECVEFRYGANGKPALAPRFTATGWHFNVSHCGELAVFALSSEGEVGVDVEAIREVRDADAIAARVFSRRENDAYRALSADEKPLAFLQLWTRKEACVKLLGEGLCAPLDRFDVSLAPNEPCPWRLETFTPLAGFVGALATRG